MCEYRIKSICCVGAGYVGGPTMAIIALKCPQIKVTVVDLNADRIAAWNSDNLPIFEPGLHEVVMQTRGKNLFFTTDVEKGIEESDMIFLSVNVSVFVVGLPSDSHKDVRYRCWKRGEPALSGIGRSYNCEGIQE